MLLTWSNQSINDYYDVETDIANERFDRPLARGDLSRDFVRNLSAIMFLSSIVIISFLVVLYNVTIWLLLFTLVFIAVGIGYNLGIKEIGFLGNIKENIINKSFLDLIKIPIGYYSTSEDNFDKKFDENLKETFEFSYIKSDRILIWLSTRISRLIIKNKLQYNKNIKTK